jgi:hypothetical protein
MKASEASYCQDKERSNDYKKAKSQKVSGGNGGLMVSNVSNVSWVGRMVCG